MINLSLLIIIPLLTAVAILLVPKAQSRWVAFLGAIVQLGYSVELLLAYTHQRAAGNKATMLFEAHYPWFKSLNIEYYVGVDGISIAMILLTAIVVLAGVLVSWNVSKLTKEFFFLIALLSMGAYGFFISLDMFALFFFLEVAVIPKFLLIGIWGSGKKEYSAMKLALMLMGGSALVLIGMLALYLNTNTDDGGHTFNLMQLAHAQFPIEMQRIVFPFLFVGFSVFTALFPFHTWAPDGHSSAPTAASMFLAGISMKLGGYGCLRVATYIMPEAAHEYSWIIILLSTIAIIYGAFATLMQTDLKYINAYSSVSHCGFVIFGIGMLTRTAITGAVLQMVSHGLMTALFFAAIGMIYERTHTRQIAQLGGLLKSIPFIMTIFVLAGLCSLGLPGLSGFVAEMTVFVGAWEKVGMYYRVSTVLACASIVVTAVYILRAVGSTAMGPVKNQEYLSFSDAGWNEKLASVVLMVSILIIGIAPFLLNNLISADTGVLMENITRGLAGK
jgi:NADH-quinone oxidoreductase subunit M